MHEQTEARVFRDGQTSPVMSYYILADVGADPIMMDVLNLKGSQLAGIRDHIQRRDRAIADRPRQDSEDGGSLFGSDWRDAKGERVRIAILGPPRCGKTVLSMRLGDVTGMVPQHTDDLCGVTWDGRNASQVVAEEWMAASDWLVEGVACVRAIRKRLAMKPTEKPADYIIYLTEPFEILTHGQLAMAKGHWTIWDGIEPKLRELGCAISMGQAPALNGPLGRFR